MTYTERVSLFLGGIVSFLSIMGGVWWFAISANDMKHEIKAVSTRIESIETNMQEDREALKTRSELFRGLQRSQELIMTDMITLVYLDDDEVVMSSADGRTFRVPLSKKPSQPNG